MSYVRFEKDDHIAIITIDRQNALNALNADIFDELAVIISQLEQSRDIYAVIVTGAGRAFIAGADIKEFSNYSTVDIRRINSIRSKHLLRLENLPMPVIAAINGYALGGGLELAMACDIRLAAETAKVGMPETSLGTIPGLGGSLRLPRIVGMTKAMELIFTARTITAAEAEKIGLVSAVYPADELMDKAMEMARLIAANGPFAVAQAKACIRMGMQTDIATGIAYECEALSAVYATEDKQEGAAAFIEKRKEKHFKNR